MERLTQERLKELHHYDAETGVFTNRINRHGCKKGTISGSINKSHGYRSIMIDRKPYTASRLAWLYVYGYMPEFQIDHINRIRNDNRLINLRHVSPTCNQRNCKKAKNNKSGITGVYWYEKKKQWYVQISIDSKNILIGHSIIFDDAVMMRWQAEKKYDYPTCCTTSTAFQYLKENGFIKEVLK